MKTDTKVHIYYRTNSKKTRNGLPVYDAWPILSHHDKNKAIAWANYSHSIMSTPQIKSHGIIVHDNIFYNSMIVEETDSRYRSAKVPKVDLLVHNGPSSFYVRVDFRSDSLIETLMHSTVTNGLFSSPLSLVYNGANYYLTPYNKSKYLDALKNSNIGASSTKKKGSQKAEIGKFYIGAFNSCYQYLGKFVCVQDDSYRNSSQDQHDYTNQTVHVYREVSYDEQTNTIKNKHFGRSPQEPIDYYFSITKSKMKVYDEVIPSKVDLTEMKDFIKTDFSIKACYGLGNSYVELNNVSKIMAFKEKPRKSCRTLFHF